MPTNRLLPTNINYGNSSYCNSVIIDDNWLWHMRLGHLNFGSITFLANKEWVLGLPTIQVPDQVCEPCVMGKKHRDPFPTRQPWRAKSPLELVHSDLCYVEVPSNGGALLELRKKLDGKAEKCISRDVTFDEDGVWDWSEEEKKSLLVPVFINNEVEAINQIGNNSKFLSEFREDMIAQFEMIDIGLMSYFLGIEVKQTNKGVFISQKKYAGDILRKFKMEACNPILIPVEERLKLVKDGSGDLVNATNFRRLVGSLMYLTTTRLDIVYGAGIVSSFMNSPQ
ncbi:hypothetical protein RJ640_020074 [Escallonia rubra]|uniref:Uncharacterized protein n=1 Tax=Escallonia rubra TaxID=112253 RepID=A0AA88R014_9ASTE|nr:hypothetical protein RJ640_020074 [Escallonia rubra]